jgi:hypothetical protein
VWTSGSVVITDQKYNQRTNETKFPETFGLREGKMKKIKGEKMEKPFREGWSGISYSIVPQRYTTARRNDGAFRYNQKLGERAVR